MDFSRENFDLFMFFLGFFFNLFTKTIIEMNNNSEKFNRRSIRRTICQADTRTSENRPDKFLFLVFFHFHYLPVSLSNSVENCFTKYFKGNP